MFYVLCGEMMLNISKQTLNVGEKQYKYFDIRNILGNHIRDVPYSLKILLENIVRNNSSTSQEGIDAIVDWTGECSMNCDVNYYPARILMQDFTGVPVIVDLAAMRDAMLELSKDPNKINPMIPIDLVIDHSVQVDKYASATSYEENVSLEMGRNEERYKFLRWGQSSLDNFRVVPPGTGICHQVNLEYLAKVVWSKEEDGEILVYPDTLVGTDSHTTMVNGLSVFGWGVGGIEAESAMLGQPIVMKIPEVIGVEFIGELTEWATATDLVLTVTQKLREYGVVGKFVEFFGSGLKNLQLPNRATIANMAPEYGATCGFFPIDQNTLDYLRLSGRDEEHVSLVESYAKAQSLWHDESSRAKYTDILTIELSKVEPSVAGPKRPQDRVVLSNVKKSCGHLIDESFYVNNKNYEIKNGDIILAAITSCTNTSNPDVMIMAGLVAKKAVALGLKVKPWVKTSFAPGSKVVTHYLRDAGLQEYLDKIGFNLVGYGCTTCIGNSGPIDKDIEDSIKHNNIVASAILSGNRNFEGRIHPLSQLNYLASPPLVVIYAFIGTMLIDLLNDPIAKDIGGNEIYLKDLWPSRREIDSIIKNNITSDIFIKNYANVFEGDKHWLSLNDEEDSITYNWDENSTYIQKPPYFENIKNVNNRSNGDIKNANILLILGDSVTTDHISPAGVIAENSPAASYLRERGIDKANFNSYGSRRGNHNVMMRGTFANIRISNEMLNGQLGGFTKHIPTGNIMPIYDAAMHYKSSSIPLVVVAGKEYGTGSSRDWAAKGTLLLGIRAVIAESFERIHRSNLIGMGVLPLIFPNGVTRKTLNLVGDEMISIVGINGNINTKTVLECTIMYSNGESRVLMLKTLLFTEAEVSYFIKGGILQKVLLSI